jgi:hypothetical protein
VGRQVSRGQPHDRMQLSDCPARWHYTGRAVYGSRADSQVAAYRYMAASWRGSIPSTSQISASGVSRQLDTEQPKFRLCVIHESWKRASSILNSRGRGRT